MIPKRQMNTANHQIAVLLMVAITSSAWISTNAFVPPSSKVSKDPIMSNHLPQSASASLISKRQPFISSSELYMAGNLQPLAKEGAWTAYLDEETTGLVYYFNTDTGESLWAPPTETFPDIKLNRRKEKQMQSVRSKYNEQIEGPGATNEESQVNDAAEDGSGGIFGSLFSMPKLTDDAPVETDADANAVTDANEEMEQIENTSSKPSFFNFFGSNDNTNTAKEQEAVAVEEETFYDQTMFEDAVAIDDTGVVDEATSDKKSFLPGFMSSFASPPKQATETETEPEPQSLKVAIGSKILPHPEKVSWGGEDAVFVKGRSFGVFDGVSGAEKLNGVPLYSNTLAQRFKLDSTMESMTTDEIRVKLLNAAEYADVSATGASTALVASIGEDDVLRTLNLGDCVLLVVRNGSITSRTRENTHYFDCPYQLSEESPDRPKDSTVMQTKLQAGDVIVAGSDGVFDNLVDGQIIDIVSDPVLNGKTSAIAKKIVSESRRVSQDTEAPTPYAKLAKRNRYENYASGLGGKVDDVSCVVVSVN